MSYDLSLFFIIISKFCRIDYQDEMLYKSINAINKIRQQQKIKIISLVLKKVKIMYPRLNPKMKRNCSQNKHRLNILND